MKVNYLPLFKIIQLLWALALLGIVVPIFMRNNEFSLLLKMLIIFIILYAMASFGILFDHRWAWVVSVVFLGGYWILRGWISLANFVINFYMFITGHELYRDSPMTIVIVVINSFFGILPGTILLIFGILSRNQILAIIRGKRPLGTHEKLNTI
jgi:hypothetical protein